MSKIYRRKLLAEHVGDATHDFDLGCTAAQVFARGHQVLVDAIDNDDLVGEEIRTATLECWMRLVPVAPVTMARGLRQDGTRRKNPGSV